MTVPGARALARLIKENRELREEIDRMREEIDRLNILLTPEEES